jgi:hypothetical protein
VEPSKRASLGELKGTWAETNFQIESFNVFIEKSTEKKSNASLKKKTLNDLADFYQNVMPSPGSCGHQGLTLIQCHVMG